MTHEMAFIVSSAGLLVGIAGLVLARLMARQRTKELAARTAHPAE